MLSPSSKSQAEPPEIHSQAEPEKEKNEKSQALSAWKN